MLNTINVIHIKKKYDIKCYSFQNESKCIIKAEEKFVEVVKSFTEEPIDLDFMESILDDGIYEFNDNIVVINYSEEN